MTAVQQLTSADYQARVISLLESLAKATPGVGFLIGTRTRGTMIGEFPGLGTGLDEDGNVRATSDYRGIYAGLLEQSIHLVACDAIEAGVCGFELRRR